MFQLFTQHPEVGVVLIFLLAVASHVTVGALLHWLRLKDFDWHKLGGFVEQDFATTRGLSILSTFVMTMVTQLTAVSSWKAAFGVSLAALVASCAAATLPVLRDTLYEALQLLTGFDPTAKV